MPRKKAVKRKRPRQPVSQKVSQKQAVTVIVNAPKRRAGQARKRTISQQNTLAEMSPLVPSIQMRPVVPPNPLELYYSYARPQQTNLLEPQRPTTINYITNQQPLPLITDRQRELAKRDSFLDENLFGPPLLERGVSQQTIQSIDGDVVKRGEPIADVGELFRELPSRVREAYVPPNRISTGGDDRYKNILTYTVGELRQVAKDGGLTGYSGKNKAELAKFLMDNLTYYSPPPRGR